MLNAAPRAAKNFAYLSSSVLLARVSGFVTAILIARSLSVSEYGAYSSALALIALVTIVLDFGLSPTLTQRIAANPNDAKILMAGALGFRITLAFFLIGAVGLVGLLLPASSVTSLMALVSISLLPTAILTTIQSYLNSVERLRPHAMANTLVSIVVIPLTWIGVQLWGIWGAGLAFVLQAFLTAGLLVFLVAHERVPLYLGMSFRLAQWKELARSAIPFFLLAALTAIYWRIDVLMLLKMVGESAVGIYTVAYRFVEAVLVWPPLVGAAVIPIIARLASKGEQQAVVRIVGNVARYLLFLTLLGAFLMARNAQALVILVFGKVYAPAVPVMQILIWVIVLVSVNSSLTLIFYAHAQAQRIVWIPLMMAGLNVTINLLLIPQYNTIGAAASTVITEAFGILFILIALHRAHIPLLFRPLVTAAVQGISAGLASLIIMAFIRPLALQLAAGCAAFGVVLVALGGLNREDGQFIRKVVASLRTEGLYG